MNIAGAVPRLTSREKFSSFSALFYHWHRTISAFPIVVTITRSTKSHFFLLDEIRRKCWKFMFQYSCKHKWKYIMMSVEHTFIEWCINLKTVGLQKCGHQATSGYLTVESILYKSFKPSAAVSINFLENLFFNMWDE